MTPLHDIAETAAALGQDYLAEQIWEWAGEVERLRIDAARLDRLDADDAAFLARVALRLFARDYTTSPISRRQSVRAAIDAEMKGE